MQQIEPATVATVAMRLRHLLIFFTMSAALPAATLPETVVLLHGLGMSGWTMSRIEHRLASEGYRVVNLTYPSRTVPVETLAGEWLPAQLAAHEIAAAPRVNFVTHSMGGIVVRAWLDDFRQRGIAPPANLGRTVMLAPPNQGTVVAEKLAGFSPFRWFTGVNGHRLGTSAAGLPRSLGPWPANAGELGIIAGNRWVNPLFIFWFDGPNDGTVAVTHTHLASERAHQVLPYSHALLPWRDTALDLVSAFLRTGTFESP
jgi:pimeloyl-ACP methyl ester carboxylesterase